MSDQEIRRHLRSALEVVVNAERSRVSAILDDSKTRIAQGVEKMKPIIALIRELKEEVGDVDGLKISPAEHGHMAVIRAQTSSTTDSLSISTNYANSAFVIDESHSFSVDGSYDEGRKEYPSTEDVMARVMEIVGRHIGAQQAQKAHRDA
jgi:hypothetical protein